MTDRCHLPTRPPGRRTGRRLVVGGLLILVILFAAVELVLRLRYGLGNPVLYLSDPDIEYLPKPSQQVRRLGNRITYNAYSMRSRAFGPTKADRRELRVLVLGDSIVNGGNYIDQSDLATEQLVDALRQSLKRPVVVGNISAGSWGPVNLLAYLQRFGLFEAQVVVLVLSSHDQADVPAGGVEVRRDWPRRRPLLAITELPSYLARRSRRRSRPASNLVRPSAADVQWSMDAVCGIVELARGGGARVVVVQHLTKEEVQSRPQPGHAVIRQTAATLGIDTIQLGPAFAAALQGGNDPYRDAMHPSAHGQALLAQQLQRAIEQALRTPTPAETLPQPPNEP